MIHIAESDHEISRCLSVMQQLRPHLVASKFVATVQRQMLSGYQLIYIKKTKSEDLTYVVAVAGFRIVEKLDVGKSLIVDDLSVFTKYKSHKYDTKLLVWMRKRAMNEGCNCLEYDSNESFSGNQSIENKRFYIMHRVILSSRSLDPKSDSK